MRNGYKVIDVDTHVTPSWEILQKYGDAELLSRTEEVEPYVRVTTPTAGRGHPTEDYGVVRVNPYPYNRVAGHKEKDDPATRGAGARGALEGRVENLAVRPIADRIQHDNSVGRLENMDVEGVDMNFIIPGTWAPGSSALETTLAQAMHRSYHRYMADYCSADPRRLKGMLLAAAADPEASARMIEQHADEEWVAGVWVVLPEGLPIDDPDLDPIWGAMNEADLPIVHHSFFYEAPYFPGYRDIWGNAAVARTAAHVWGAQRMISYIMVSGMLDKYPNLRVGTVETGHGWLANWIIRLSSQVNFVKGGVLPADLKHSPAEYVEAGRVFCGIEQHEGPVMTKAVIDILGDGVLMYESDFPHPECAYPDSTDNVLAWESVLGEQAMRKLMAENAARFLRLLSDPWSDDASETVGATTSRAD
jgi:predicted TIM-barrel fold metal-dependent hydrolase